MAEPPNNASPPNTTELLSRLLTLPDKLRAQIIGYVVTSPLRISLLTSTPRIYALCRPFHHHSRLLATAREQVLSSNVFFWPPHLPNTPLLARQIRHLEIDLRITINGGVFGQAQSFALPTADAAHITAIPDYFPSLETLVVNVENLARITPGAIYIDTAGIPMPADARDACRTIERQIKMIEIVRRVKRLRFTPGTSGMTVKRKIVFVQSVESSLHVRRLDFNATQDAGEWSNILDWPVVMVTR